MLVTDAPPVNPGGDCSRCRAAFCHVQVRLVRVIVLDVLQITYGSFSLLTHTLALLHSCVHQPTHTHQHPTHNNMANIWGIFMNSTREAAIHLGNDHDANLRNVKNSFWRSAGQLFRETERVSNRDYWYKPD